MIRKWRNQREISNPQTEGWKKWHLGTYTKKTYRKPSEQLFLHRRPLSYPKLTKNMKTYIRLKQHKKYDSKTQNNKNHNRSIALERSVI